MKTKWKESRRIIFLLISVITSILVLMLYRYDPAILKGIDLKMTDVRFRLRKGMKPDPRIVIVTIDQKSVNELGRWPWPRTVMANLIEKLAEYGVKVVALDIVFSERSDPEADRKLANAIKKAGNVILGYFFRYNKEKENEICLKSLERYKIRIIRFIGNEIKQIPVPVFPFIELNIPELSKEARGFGFFNISPDRDGICRNYNLIALYGENFFPSLALAAAREYLWNEPVISIAPYGIDSISLGKRKIVVDEMGRCVINYYGGAESFPMVSAVDVIKGRVPRSRLKDKVVFVGATEIGIYDVRATPVDPVLPGVLIHATVLSNILQNRYLIRDSRVIALEVIFMFLFPMLMAFMLSYTRHTFLSIIMLAIFILAYGTTNTALFSTHGLNLGMIYPVISILSTYIGCEAYRNLIEVRKSRFLQKAFSSYISPELVSQIVKNPDMLKLGGEKREVTILFSDIRSFTSISERFSPEIIVRLLNRYLDPMTNIVLSNKGTLDKYIGDAIMAIYNAPLEIEDHAVLACKSAVEMIEALNEVNQEFKAMGFPEIDIGIGIHTGDAVVGNMGTDVRFDYTAIGDTVNLSSRLESLNKLYRTHIIVSQSTRERIKGNEFRFRELDMIRVKGKKIPITIYEINMDMDEEFIDLYHKALSLYKFCNFKSALEYFSTLERDYNDATSGVFAERCRQLILNQPPPDWDGVYVATSK